MTESFWWGDNLYSQLGGFHIVNFTRDAFHPLKTYIYNWVGGFTRDLSSFHPLEI